MPAGSTRAIGSAEAEAMAAHEMSARDLKRASRNQSVLSGGTRRSKVDTGVSMFMLDGMMTSLMKFPAVP